MQCNAYAGIFKTDSSNSNPPFAFSLSSTFQTPRRSAPTINNATPKTKQGAKESFSRLFPFSFIPDLNAAKATTGNITLGGTGEPVKSKGSSTLPSTAFKVVRGAQLWELTAWRQRSGHRFSPNSPTFTTYPSRELISEVAGEIYNHSFLLSMISIFFKCSHY